MTIIAEWDDILTPDSARTLNNGAILTAVANIDDETRKSDRNTLPPFGILGEIFRAVDWVIGPLVRLQSMVHRFRTPFQALHQNIMANSFMFEGHLDLDDIRFSQVVAW